MEQLDALILLYPTHARHYLTRCGLYEQRKEYEVIISTGFSWTKPEDLARLLKLFK